MAKGYKLYKVMYKMHNADNEHEVEIYAKNKYDAYDRAVYDWIPQEEKSIPYSAWVSSYKTAKGKIHEFSSFEGNPYGDK